MNIFFTCTERDFDSALLNLVGRQQFPDTWGGVHCQVLPLKNVICWHTECWGREGKQFVTELDHFLHWWDFFVHMLYSISASMFSPLGCLSEEENKGSRSHCVVGFLLFFFGMCVCLLELCFCMPELNYGGCAVPFTGDSVCRIW